MLYFQTPLHVRPSRQGGFTVIELLIVLVVIGVLVSIAVPSYLGLQTRAGDAAAKANIRTAFSAAEAFALDNVGAKGDADNKAATTGYQGMSAALLRAAYDRGLAANLAVVSGKTTTSQFCLTDTERGQTWSALGPSPAGTSFKNNAKCK